MRTVAICGALVAFPSLASAQVELTERLRLQGIYTLQTGAPPPRDLAAQAIPELSLLSFGKRSIVRATYTLTGTVHTEVPADLANRLNVTSTFDLSKRTTLLLSAEGGHTAMTNALIAQQAASTPVGITPITVGQFAYARVTEGTSWEASPVVRLGQTLDAAYTTTINAPLAIESYLASAVFSVDRSWKTDALGIDFRGGYARSHTEPTPPLRLIPLAVTPHWRHDISRTLTSYLAGGVAVVVSPDPGTRPLVGPFGQGSLSYLLDDATLELSGSVGPLANGVTAQLLYAEQVTLRALVPLSLAHAVVASTSVGYTHGSIIERRRDVPVPPDIHSFIADTTIGWSPIPSLELFARYQFLDQITGDTTGLNATGGPTLVSTPAVLRNVFIVGIQLSSRPDTVRVRTRFPQRVDRSDAQRGP